ncbi:dCMP deaminase family protein [Methylobacterium sp. 1973]|uniref:deoxycytidylate deaminase n=1 Tax=Methylobacterium sp. 1973 TaxID=3156421 RepID=UPI0033939E25
MTDWPSYLMSFAQLAATKSKDSTQVGAVLVAPNGRSVLLTAYNGPPAGVDDLPERRERPAKYLYACHAELGLISTAARHGIRTEGCTAYVTHHPCSACARTLIQAGIRSVVYGDGTTSMPPEEFTAAETMFAEAGVIARRRVAEANPQSSCGDAA